MLASKRLLVNTSVTYCRSIFAVALGLLSSRWILEGLGQVDFGLMAVVGALIGFVEFLNNILANAAARFLAFSIGKDNEGETQRWFNVSLFLHIVAPLALISIGWPIGEWALDHFIKIPDHRLVTAHWVFRLSLILAFISMSFAPFRAMFIAKQDIAEMAIWGIAGSIANFILAYVVWHYSGDSWLFFSICSVAISSSLVLMQIGRAYKKYEECRIQFDLWLDWVRFRKLLSFSGWNLFGGLGQLLRGQGIAILLNRYFNPISTPGVNASYTISNTVSSSTQQLSSSLIGAFSPEINANEGRGDRKRMLIQANRASKFGAYLTLLFAIPLILEIEYVLDLWLVQPPVYASGMTSLILCAFIIDRLTVGQMLAVSARGKIAGYQIMLGGFLLLTLPVAWLFLHLGLGPISVCWAYLITMSLCSIGRVFWAKSLVQFLPSIWIKEVFLPLNFLIIVSVFTGRMSQLFLDASLGRLSLVVAATLMTNIVLGWNLLLNINERKSLLAALQSSLKRIFKLIRPKK